MANIIRTGDPRGFNKGCSSKFRAGSRVRQTPEEGRRTYQPNRCGNNNKDEDNSPKILHDKNHQVSSQKFRQETPEEGRRTYRPKRCGNNNKNEDNSPKTLNDSKRLSTIFINSIVVFNVNLLSTVFHFTQTIIFSNNLIYSLNNSHKQILYRFFASLF